MIARRDGARGRGYTAGMRSLRARVVLAALALGAGCGSQAGDSSTRAANPTNPNPQGIGPSGDTGPPARDMSGGGRGSMSPHEKGK